MTPFVANRSTFRQNHLTEKYLNQLIDKLLEITTEFSRGGEDDEVPQSNKNSERFEVVSLFQMYQKTGKRQVKNELAKIAHFLSKSTTKLTVLAKPPASGSGIDSVTREIVALARKLVDMANRFPTATGQTLCRAWRVTVSSILASLIHLANGFLSEKRDFDKAFSGSFLVHTGMVWNGCDSLEILPLNNSEAVQAGIADMIDIIEDAKTELAETGSEADGGIDDMTRTFSTFAMYEDQRRLEDEFWDISENDLAEDEGESGDTWIDLEGTSSKEERSKRFSTEKRNSTLKQQCLDLVSLAVKSLRRMQNVCEHYMGELASEPSMFFELSSKSVDASGKLSFTEILRLEDRAVNISESIAASVDDLVISLTSGDCNLSMDSLIHEAKTLANYIEEMLTISKELAKDLNPSSFSQLVDLSKQLTSVMVFILEKNSLR